MHLLDSFVCSHDVGYFHWNVFPLTRHPNIKEDLTRAKLLNIHDAGCELWEVSHCGGDEWQAVIGELGRRKKMTYRNQIYKCAESPARDAVHYQPMSMKNEMW